MRVILINSQKGGSGKTMLAKHLSVEAEREGEGPVVIIDTDPQGSLTAWHAKREAEAPARVELEFSKLSQGLDQLRRRGVAYCFIDTASGRVEIARELFKLVDYVLFPVQASEDDLTAAPVTVRALKEIGVPFLFVLTRVKPNTLITAQAAALLSKHGEVAEAFISDRTAYKSPFAAGQTISEAQPSGTAAKEIQSLWKLIKVRTATSQKERGAHAESA